MAPRFADAMLDTASSREPGCHCVERAPHDKNRWLCPIIILTLLTPGSASANADADTGGDSKLTVPANQPAFAETGLGIGPYVEYAGSVGTLGSDIGASIGLLHNWQCADGETRMQLRLGLVVDVARFGVPPNTDLVALPDAMFLWGGEAELGFRLPRTVARVGPYLSLQTGGSDSSGTDFNATLIMAGIRFRYRPVALGVELTHAWTWET